LDNYHYFYHIITSVYKYIERIGKHACWTFSGSIQVTVDYQYFFWLLSRLISITTPLSNFVFVHPGFCRESENLVDSGVVDPFVNNFSPPKFFHPDKEKPVF